MGVTIVFAGGHAKQCIDVFLERGETIDAILDDSWDGSDIPFYRGYSITGKISDVVGQAFCAAGDIKAREVITTNVKALWVNCISKAAHVSPGAEIGFGCYIGAFALVGPNAEIGNFCIVNEGARVTHDCILGSYCNISPGATLCGRVQLTSRVFIGANATVNPKVKICSNTTVGSGGVVIRDICFAGVWGGVPVKRI